MNYKLALEHLGLKENIDFVITESTFEMLPKTRIMEISPQVLDEAGNILQEAVTEEQQYMPAAPSEEEIQISYEEVLLKAADLALLINEYLSDKSELRDPENDELNISNGQIVRWGFANIPQPTRSELVALISQAENKQNQAEINEQALKYLAETDFYIIRELDSGVPCPLEIKQLRQAARNSIVR